MSAVDDVRRRLVEGNEAYRSRGAFGGRVDAALRQELADGQRPYAIVVSCSDSRVLPEAIFSAGLGELFVIRVAGNVIGEEALGSIQYAHEHLGCGLAVVLGHTGCGAVHAAVSGGAGGYAGALIRPILDVACDCSDERDVAIAHARAGAERIREAFPDADLTAAPALYDIVSGTVTWLT